MTSANFYTIAMKMAGKKIVPPSAGIVIADAVVANRLFHFQTFERGDVQDFRNKEMNWVFSSLESLVEQDDDSMRDSLTASAMRLLSGNHRSILEEHRELYRVNYVFDALSYFWQNNHPHEPRENLGSVSAYLGHPFMELIKSGRTHPSNAVYQALKRTQRDEYVGYLASLTRKLNRRFSMQLELAK
jgi:hypothetical protein